MKSPEEIAEQVVNLFVTDAHGVYIPRIACQALRDHFESHPNQSPGEYVADCVEKLASEDVNPYEYEHYWDDWMTVTDSVEYVVNGDTYRLYQDGDLWQINQTALESLNLSDEESEAFWGSFA